MDRRQGDFANSLLAFSLMGRANKFKGNNICGVLRIHEEKAPKLTDQTEDNSCLSSNYLVQLWRQMSTENQSLLMKVFTCFAEMAESEIAREIAWEQEQRARLSKSRKRSL